MHAGGVKKSGAVLALGTPVPSSSRADGHRSASPPRRRSRSSSQPLRDRDAGRGKASRRPSTAASLPLLSAPPPRTVGRARAPYRRAMSSSPAAPASPPPPAAAADEGARAAEAVAVDERVASHVDPFLVEALDNPRHRLMGTCRPPPHVSARRLARDFGVVGSRVRGCDRRGGSAWAGCWISARIRASCP